MQKLKIVIPTYNALPWLERCLEMVARQSYRDFECCVVDDASTDPRQHDLIEATCRRHGWERLFEERNLGPLHSLVRGIERLRPGPEEVIVTIDGDDWLASDDSLQQVVRAYDRGGIDLTYGQFIYYPSGKLGYARMPERQVVEQRLYRTTTPWWCHLRTFRAFLWQAIRDADLRAPGGAYYRYGADHAFMNPMLEMVGERFCALEAVTYVYNRSTEGNTDKVAAVSEICNRFWIRSLPKYDILPRSLS